LRTTLKRFERIRQRGRAAEQLGSGGIGEVFTLPRDGQLQQRRGKRREYDGADQSDPAERSPVVLLVSEGSENWKRLAIAAIAPATIAAIEETRMSRFLM
jgi:hypothetical protein